MNEKKKKQVVITSEYICDDRDMIEKVGTNKNMSDKEVKKYINELDPKTKNTD